jgi:hypothetical protein
MINSNLLCAGCFSGFNKNITAHNFSPRRDLMQIIYVLNRFFYKELVHDINFRIPIISYHIFNISPVNPEYSIYYPDIYTRTGLGNIGHDLYSIFNPKNMLDYFKKNKDYNVELCKNMIGDKWDEYIENNSGASKELSGGADIFEKKYLKYKIKYDNIKKQKSEKIHKII